MVADFVVEIAGSVKFFFDYVRRKPYTRGPRVTVTGFDGKTRTKMNLDEAFGVSMPQYRTYPPSESTSEVPPRVSYDENIRLAPYSYVSPPQLGSATMSPSSSRGSLDAYPEPKMGSAAVGGLCLEQESGGCYVVFFVWYITDGLSLCDVLLTFTHIPGTLHRLTCHGNPH